MQTKICSKCGQEKTIDKFYKAKSGKYGVRGDCKKCHNQKKKEIKKRKMINEIKRKNNAKDEIEEKDRQCKVCGEVKGNDGFYKSDLKQDYLVCKECRRKRAKKNKIKRIKKGEQK